MHISNNYLRHNKTYKMSLRYLRNEFVLSNCPNFLYNILKIAISKIYKSKFFTLLIIHN